VRRVERRKAAHPAVAVRCSYGSHGVRALKSASRAVWTSLLGEVAGRHRRNRNPVHHHHHPSPRPRRTHRRHRTNLHPAQTPTHGHRVHPPRRRIATAHRHRRVDTTLVSSAVPPPCATVGTHGVPAVRPCRRPPHGRRRAPHGHRAATALEHVRAACRTCVGRVNGQGPSGPGR